MTESTGNKAMDRWLEELDIRCAGGRDTPPDAAARLRRMRPAIRSVIFSDPDAAEKKIQALAAEMGFEIDFTK